MCCDAGVLMVGRGFAGDPTLHACVCVYMVTQARGDSGVAVSMGTLQRGDCFGEQSLPPSDLLKRHKRKLGVVARGEQSVVTLVLTPQALGQLRTLSPTLEEWAARLVRDIATTAAAGVDAVAVSRGGNAVAALAASHPGNKALGGGGGGGGGGNRSSSSRSSPAGARAAAQEAPVGDGAPRHRIGSSQPTPGTQTPVQTPKGRATPPASQRKSKRGAGAAG